MEGNGNSLERIPADRRLIEQLYAHAMITGEARAYALNLLLPHDRWGVWVSRLLLAGGAALMLAGVIYFFAFNWAKVPPLVKLACLQAGIILCLAGAWARSLERLGGRVCLLCASVLVGVFMAVFGQIYQTGADAYQLFMMWSLLTLGWTLIANFAAQWAVWLLITQLFLIAWWRQAALPAEGMESMIFIYMATLNGIALAMREYFAMARSCAWLGQGWTRMVLVITTLLILLLPVIIWILEEGQASLSIVLSGLFGLAGHGAAYFFYRYRIPDIRALAATVLSVCLIAEVAGFRIIWEILPGEEAAIFLMMTLMTLGVFTGAIIYLRRTTRRMETGDA